MLKVLHLSDTTLSGSPIRISNLLRKHSKKIVSRHLVWSPVTGKRVFETDMVGFGMSPEDLRDKLQWADIIHYHNRYARQDIFKFLGEAPPKKPSVIQMHSPRFSEEFGPEVSSGVPLAVVGQYHPRQWPEATFIVPNVVDIFDQKYLPVKKPDRTAPVISYAPSNTNARGWDDKGYNLVVPHLKRLALDRKVVYQPIIQQPHDRALSMKRYADIGIDEIATGSYHLSSLEYMAMGIPCFARLDALTTKTVMDMTGADKLPWIIADRDSFLSKLLYIIYAKSWKDLGDETRAWMEKYWNPQFLLKKYEDMYESLI